jgi:hypothetical protein
MACPICDQKPTNCDCSEAERRMHAEIEELRGQLPRWIPVGEQTPDSAEIVLLLMPRNDGDFACTTGCYIAETQRWFPRATRHGWLPSHWMPIPAPPEVTP